MPLYKDLTACEILFLRFSFHVAGGLEVLDSFWEDRGLDRTEERLVFAPYVRRKTAHTIYISWARNHAHCADVFLALHAEKAESLFPKTRKPQRCLSEQYFREFFDMVHLQNIPSGIRAEYGYPAPLHLRPIFRPDRSVRLSSISLESLDDDGKLVMTVSTSRKDKDWVTVVEPAGHISFLDRPVGDDFFDAPFKTACALGASLRRKEE